MANEVAVQAKGKQAHLVHNVQENRWEARYPGKTGAILCKGGRGYVVDMVESGRCNKAKKLGIEGRGSLIEEGSGPVIANADGSPVQPVEERFSINERFSFLEDYVIGVAKRRFPSLVITGEGGLGKSFTVHKALADPKGGKLMNASDTFVLKKVLPEGFEGDEEDAKPEDYIEIEVPSVPNDNFLKPEESRKYYTVVKGFSTAKGLYEVLYHNRNRVIVFDDCDSILKDPTALNLLKGALDSYDKRIISWRSKGMIDDGLPDSFEFKGGIIFISNKQLYQIDQAIRSRSLCVDVTMNTKQKIERMEKLVETGEFMPNYDEKVKKRALKFLEEMQNDAAELNFRTLIQVVKFADEGDNERGTWKRRAEYFLVNGTPA